MTTTFGENITWLTVVRVDVGGPYLQGVQTLNQTYYSLFDFWHKICLIKSLASFCLFLQKISGKGELSWLGVISVTIAHFCKAVF